MWSVWEKSKFFKADIIILGAGLTGLSAAASIKEKNPAKEVLVLDQHVIPKGASTRNAGFACFGSLSELYSDMKNMGPSNMAGLVEKRWKGLQKTRERLGDGQIGLEMKKGYELFFYDEKALGKMDEINRLLQPIFDDVVFEPADDLIGDFGFRKTKHLVVNQFEGQLDTGALMRSLWGYCSEKDVRIHTGCAIEKFESSDSGVELVSDHMTFHCRQLIICTNGFVSEMLPKLKVKPGRGLVMHVVPEKGVPFEGSFHYEEGFYYFRDYGKKGMLFGGGRQVDMKAEETTKFGMNIKVFLRLEDELKQYILPDNPYKIKNRWSGIMGFGKSKEPIVQAIDARTFVGVRLGGMGVAISSLVGEQLADLVLNAE